MVVTAENPEVVDAGIETDVAPSPLAPRQVEREFKKLLAAGTRIQAVGGARTDPNRLLHEGYTPKHKLELFGCTFYLTNLRMDENFRFFVAYVLMPGASGGPPRSRVVHPRIFYKDSSLVWRSPTHCIRSDDENWIGKGDLKVAIIDGEEMEFGAEETTNLPLEIQCPLDVISRKGGRVRRDLRAVPLVLRNAPNDRFEPYQDFSGPRRAAMSLDYNLVNGGEFVAFFTRVGDPTSLRFSPGFEPDFAGGIVEVCESKSRLYGGGIRKFRIVSSNRQIQYQFIAAPRHVWIIPPQTLTPELMSYAVRTVDVNADEDLFVPGYEYHYIDDSEDPPLLHSQIPEGYAGKASDVDDSRADASPWLEALPVIQEFRRTVLRR
ncbi:MAG: hypothetical protein ACE5FL_05515 [Myxococcota bacterium]